MCYSLNDELTERLKTTYGITIGIHNKHRTGKTLSGVFLIIYYLLKRVDNIKGVISNVHLKNLNDLMPDLQSKYLPLQKIKDIKKEEYKDYIIFTDEIRRLLDSRMSTSFKNRFISNLLADTGKFRQIHIYTDQEYGAVDKRVKVNVDAVLFPTMDVQKQLVQVKVFENYRQFEQAMWRTEILDMWDVEFYFPSEIYYKYYDTEQPIDDYRIEFTPKEYADKFIDWLEEKNYINHPDFKLKTRTIKLWKEETGEPISSNQENALMEWLLYNTVMPMSGRAKTED